MIHLLLTFEYSGLALRDFQVSGAGSAALLHLAGGRTLIMLSWSQGQHEHIFEQFGDGSRSAGSTLYFPNRTCYRVSIVVADSQAVLHLECELHVRPTRVVC